MTADSLVSNCLTFAFKKYARQAVFDQKVYFCTL